MKYLLGFLFLFVAALGAQGQIVSDSTYTVVRNDTFYQVRQQLYANGRRVTDEQPLGKDTTTVLNALLTQGYDLSQSFATAYIAVEAEATFRRAINGLSTVINTLTGKTYWRQIDMALGDKLLGEYQFTANGSVNPVTIIRTATGLLRLRQGSTNYTVDMYAENFIRIRNYNGTDIYLVRANDASQFTGNNRAYRLRKTVQR